MDTRVPLLSSLARFMVCLVVFLQLGLLQPAFASADCHANEVCPHGHADEVGQSDSKGSSDSALPIDCGCCLHLPMVLVPLEIPASLGGLSGLPSASSYRITDDRLPDAPTREIVTPPERA